MPGSRIDVRRGGAVPGPVARLLRIGAVLALTSVSARAPASGQPVPPVRLDLQQARTLQTTLQNRALAVRDTSTLRALRSTVSSTDFARMSRQWTLADQMVSVSFADTLSVVSEAETAQTLPSLEGVLTYRLPETQVVARSDGSTALEVFLRPRALRYDPATGDFVGEVDIWTQDPLDPETPGDLPDPMALQLLADVASVEPNPASLVRIGVPATTIRLRDPRAVDSVRALVVTARRPEGYPLSIPVMPALDLRTSADTIQAWGVERVTVTVAVVGRADVAETSVNVLAQRSPDSRMVSVSSGSPAQFAVRSGSPGPAAISATSSALGDAEAPVHYAVPWRFFAAALLGGIVGSFLAGPRRREDDEGAGRSGFGERAVVAVRGVVAGVVAAAAYLVLGLNLLPIDLPSDAAYNEGLVLLIGVFGTFAWARGVLLIQGWGSKASQAT